MTAFRTLDDLDVAGKRVLVRVDFNVPMENGVVTDATRIERALPTLQDLLKRGTKVILLSHYGRPKGKADPALSLRPLLQPLENLLKGRKVAFAEDCIGAPAEEAVAQLNDGEVLLLENLRFHEGEEANEDAFADSLAKLGDLYVNDAFSTAHRAHASVEALARRLPAAAGRLMQEELEHLEKALENPERPVAAIVGGAKVSTKLELLGNLVEKVQLLVIGGGMANTFLHAFGVPVGASLCEKDMAETVEDIVRRAKQADCDILLPTDAVVAEKLAPNTPHDVVAVRDVPDDRMILDVGPMTSEQIRKRLGDCRTLVWNGPLGAFETQPFDAGTNVVAEAVADLTAEGRLLSVAGGGDTVSALARAGVLDRLSYVSAAGGAFLEWMEGKTLPGVQALRDSAG
ncbi:phosphoglycerate kinase [Fodinicurvata fenggangensis]|uniref:phosphoglycerate kinase n=1 Tax=Fodinicurvata fenggangensis TaxID=1121830 RepID=UPI00047DFA22|nr:phosphoglycerate kinase [Fodinicurvata fenggangensis]